MYPNPQDVLPLPPHPDVDHYRERAKELVKACRAGPEAIDTWATGWVEALTRRVGSGDPGRLNPGAGWRAYMALRTSAALRR